MVLVPVMFIILVWTQHGAIVRTEEGGGLGSEITFK